jgi:O-6-methylguanine DNA methyltransferase
MNSPGRGLTPWPPRGVPSSAWARLTEFQRRVYLAVCRIPRGQTRSYRWVAERIGRPGAARAVGNALNRNPFAPIVPCHRVVRSDGSLGGYSRGQAKKRALLRKEGWKDQAAIPRVPRA